MRSHGVSQARTTSAVLIYNETSGARLAGGASREETAAILADAGLAVEALSGTVAEQLARSVESPADIVIVDGGDGTIRAAIDAHRGRGRPIGIIPGGTMNLLAHDYGIPADRRAAARVIAAGHTRAIDIGVVGPHVFLHTCLTGLPVRMGVHREKRRGRMDLLAKLALVLHALTTLPRDPRLTLELDGRRTLQSPSFAIIVGKLEARLLPLPQRSQITGGEMTVFALHPATSRDVIRLLVRGAFDTIANDPSVDTVLGRKAVIRSPRRRVHAMLDGEGVTLPSPCAVEVRTGEARIIVPRAAGEVRA